MLRFVFSVLALVLLAVLGACTFVEDGTSADISHGKVVTLSLHTSDRVKIQIEGDDKVYYVGKEANTYFASMIWVRDNGDKISLQDAVRKSNPTPIVGTWYIYEDEEGRHLEVYKNADMVPSGE